MPRFGSIARALGASLLAAWSAGAAHDRSADGGNLRHDSHLTAPPGVMSPTVTVVGASPAVIAQLSAPRPPPLPSPRRPTGRPHEFYFTRIQYTGWEGWRGWHTDYPEADLHFLFGLRRMTIIDAYESYNVIALDDPELRRYPFIYTVEVGTMALTESEVRGLRDYLFAGGFFVIDDFWGTYEWLNFEAQIRRVLPEFPIVELPRDHPIFNVFYNIDELVQVPNVGNGIRGYQTHEQDGFVPHAKGIFDDKGRLMVLINWNTDLGDAWEHADNPMYPLRFSTFAWQMGINFVIYGLSH